MDPMLGQGVYTYAEAGRLTGLSAQKVCAWFEGWGQQGSPLLLPDYQGDRLVSFLDLIDIAVVGKLREANLSMPAIRKAYRKLSEMLGSVHPFSREELLTDGNGAIFVRAVEADEEILIEITKHQRAFPKILLPYLRRIDYDPQSRFARRLRLTNAVVLDPALKFGKPVVQSAGLPTSVLVRSFRAMNEDADVVAEWYSISRDEVLAAVCFEEGTSGKAA